MKKNISNIPKRRRDLNLTQAEESVKGIRYREIKQDGTKELVPELVEETIYTMMNIVEGKSYDAKIGIIPQDKLLPEDQNTLTEAETYISEEDLLPLPGMLVYSSREGVFMRQAGIEIFGQQDDFSEIDFEEDAEVQVPPTINESLGQNGIIARNGKWLSKSQSDVAKRLGEEMIYYIEANHHLHMYVDAYNYMDDDPLGKDASITNRENIKWEWRFSSGEENYDVNVIEKIVSTKPLLQIEDIQRANIGRYTCHVSNEYGKVKSWTVMVHVNRPGEVKEQKLVMGDGQEVMTGQYTWVANDNSSQHDELFTMYDDKWLWGPDNSGDSVWIKCYWDETSAWWKQETTNENFIFDSELYPTTEGTVWESDEDTEE
tara:strand:- start:46 stop:1167 length:1122 start_codon:yes stop_codon:yes gene_type:complete